MNAAHEIKGWCPGALRPMPSGDGLLLRAKTVGPRLSVRQASVIAQIAQSCGNGLLDLSQRGQLQLRGVTDETLERAQHALHEAALLASDAEIERVLNIIAPPLAGLGAKTGFNAQDLLENLSGEIVRDALLRELPAKFCFLIDDGSSLGLASSDADIRIEAIHGGASTRIAIIADGTRDRAVIVPIEIAVASVVTLAKAFMRMREGREFELRRMRSAVQVLGIEALYRASGFIGSPYKSECRGAPRREIFGVHETGAIWTVGIGAPFGRWRAEDLSWIADRVSRDGMSDIRLTPWRAIVVPTSSRKAAEAIAASSAERELIVDGADPSLSVAACPGAPECPQARGATRNAARRLASVARALGGDDGRPVLHVSGCSKGCAMPYKAYATLVANGEGFDLVLDGRAGDAPQSQGTSLDEVEDLLMALPYKSDDVHARKREASCQVR